MLDQLSVGTDIERVRAQAEAVRAVRAGLAGCRSTLWTGEAGRAAEDGVDGLVAELDGILATLSDLEATYLRLWVRVVASGGAG